jgi:hypothetical protein
MPVPVLAPAQEALKTVRHVPLKEAADRNDAICFLFLRDIDSCEGSYGSLRRIPVGLSRSGMLSHFN